MNSYLYIIQDNVTLYWNTCGWTSSIAGARCYGTPAEAEAVLRRMIIDNVWKAVPLYLPRK